MEPFALWAKDASNMYTQLRLSNPEHALNTSVSFFFYLLSRGNWSHTSGCQLCQLCQLQSFLNRGTNYLIYSTSRKNIAFFSFQFLFSDAIITSTVSVPCTSAQSKPQSGLQRSALRQQDIITLRCFTARISFFNPDWMRVEAVLL